MQSILEICDPAKKKEVPAGTVLLSEGNTSGFVYVLAEGQIEVLRGTTRVAVVSEPGSVFGEMSVLYAGSPLAFASHGLCLCRCGRVHAV
jgi:CRP-like cAMP-binding protein